jgi:hypothetical protein
MRLLLAAFVVLSCLSTAASASVTRIDLTKATHAKSPVKYTLEAVATSGALVVTLQLPRKQPPIDHLWRIDVVIRKDGKTQLIAPLKTEVDSAGILSTELVLDPAMIKNTEIWIRTGKNAPLAETVYVIDVASFYSRKPS